MSIRNIIKLIPDKEKKNGIWISFLSLVQAILNLAGLTVLIPVIVLILDSEKMNNYPLFASHRTEVLLFVLVFIILKNLLNILISNTRTRYLNKLYHYYSEKLYKYYFDQGLLFIKDKHSDELAYNINAVSYIFTHGSLSLAFSMISETLLLLFIWIGILWYSPLVALSITVCLIPFVTIYFYWFRKKIMEYGKIENEAKRHIMTVASDTFRGYSDVRLNNAYGWFKKRLEADRVKIASSREWINRTLLIPPGIIECYTTIGLILFVLIVGNDSDTRLTLGILGIAVLRILPSLRSLITMATQWKNNAFTFDILEKTDDVEIDNYDTQQRLRFAERIHIDNISYHYSQKENFIFKNFSLSINKGESLGIRGVSGVGKTTLLNLLLGFYTPQKGTIYIDNQQLNLSNHKAWQNSIAYVPQNIFIMDATLAENIAFGADVIDLEQMMLVIEQSGLKDYLSALPDGIHTRIGQNGNFLSGGESQRVGIARALYKQAEVFFFDEITSSLDSKTEDAVMNTVQRLSQQKHLTCIIISHKETTLSFCDRVVDISKQ